MRVVAPDLLVDVVDGVYRMRRGASARGTGAGESEEEGAEGATDKVG